jgi:TonB-dependent receptor
MFNDLEDNIYQPSVAILKPFYAGGIAGNVKFGSSIAFRDRDFMSRRLRFNQFGSSGLNFFESPNSLFREENIRPNAFEIFEETRVTDRYHADRNVYAGFGQVDLAFNAKWRLIAGLRVERTDQLMATFNPFDPALNREESPFQSTDPLPAVNLIYELTQRSNLRFGFSQTVSRPDFRELALFDFLDVTGGRLVVGNPNLVLAKIQNYDARWEFFPGGNQLLAASFFYKDFTDPIEQVIQPSIGLRTSFDNAKSARNAGLELEFRRSLEFLNPNLRQFALSANFTVVDSQIDLTGAQKQVLTSLQRPMAGQSRYLYNIIGEWSKPKWRSTTRAYLNSFSGRISDVGAEGLPDVYQQGATTLDVVYELDVREGGHWKMRFSAQNLTDANWLWTQGGSTFRQYHRGRTFTIGNSFRIK